MQRRTPPRPQKRNNNTNRRHIANLKRRADFLSSRIEDYKASNGTPARDVAERNALRFALEIIDEWVKADPLFEVDWTGTEFTDRASMDEIIDLIGTAAWLQLAEAPLEDRRVEIVGARALSGEFQVIRLLLRYLADDELPTKIVTREQQTYIVGAKEVRQ